jgi:hypothetical protein
MGRHANHDCAAGTNHPDQAPLYFECPHCLYLSPAPDFESGSLPCPGCGSHDGARPGLPVDRLRRFDERVRRYHRAGEYEIAVILVETLLETILEDILARMMTKAGADTKLVALVLDTERSVGLRIGKLFPTLSGETFENVAAELGYHDFPRRWRAIRAARNAFIHGESFEDPRESLDATSACEAMTLLDQAYELFVLINNRFVAGVPFAKRKR